MNEKLNATIELFSNYLKQNNSVKKYLNNRGVSNEIIEEARLGYYPPFVDYWFPLLKGRIIVPIYDVHNQPIALSGRIYENVEQYTIQALYNYYKNNITLADKKITQWKKAKWINEPYSKSKHLFNLNNAKKHILKNNYIILVEGYFDTLVLHSYGFKNTVGISGVNLSERQMALISRYTNNLVIMLDNDDAGRQGIQKIYNSTNSIGFNSKAIILPEDYDPDTFIIKYGAEVFKNILRKLLKNNENILKINIV